MPHGEEATSSYSVQQTTVASGFVRLAIEAALMPAAPPPMTQMFMPHPSSGERATLPDGLVEVVADLRRVGERVRDPAVALGQLDGRGDLGGRRGRVHPEVVGAVARLADLPVRLHPAPQGAHL